MTQLIKQNRTMSMTAAAALLVSATVITSPAQAGKGYLSEYEYGATKTASKMMDKDDIVDTAVKAGSFNTLVTAVKAAGLVEVLKGDGPFTVFAPTDAAFAKLPAGTVEALLADKAKLAQILTYHVVPGRLEAKDVVNKDRLKTVQGSNLSISTSPKGAMVDAANIVQTDIVTKNGIIHVIDTVVLPSGS